MIEDGLIFPGHIRSVELYPIKKESPAWLGVTAMQGAFIRREAFTALRLFC